jgi:RHS repeat-associated protein
MVKSVVNGTLTWLMGDHLGSTSVTAQADGAFQSEMRYTAFGETRYENGTTPTDYQYTGQRKDRYIELIHMGARWYDPEIGHFVSADTVVPDPGNALAIDRFAYTMNNPLKYVDPSGHAACPPDMCDYEEEDEDLNQLVENVQRFSHPKTWTMEIPDELPDWSDPELVEAWIWLYNTDSGREFAITLLESENTTVFIDETIEDPKTIYYSDGSIDVKIPRSTYDDLGIALNQQAGNLGHEGYHVKYGEETLLEEFNAFYIQAQIHWEIYGRGWSSAGLNIQGFTHKWNEEKGYFVPHPQGGNPTASINNLKRWFGDFYKKYLDKGIPTGLNNY